MRITLDERSGPENRYYWSVVVPALARCWQLDRAQAHRRVKAQFNDGLSTATLTTVSFEQLMDALRRYALRVHCIRIPLPLSSGGPENLQMS